MKKTNIHLLRVHIITKQCAFIRVGHENITM